MIISNSMTLCPCRKQEAPTDLAEIARGSLKNSDSVEFCNIIERTLPRAEQDQWLTTLAQRVIDLAERKAPIRRFYDEVWESLRAEGYRRIDVEDICVLIIRLMRAGYIPRHRLP